MCDKFRHKARQYSVPIKNKNGVACLQQGISKPIMGKGGKLLKCFHCGKNCHLRDCSKIDKATKKKIMDTKWKDWQERKDKAAKEK